MVEDAHLTTSEGPMVADVQLRGPWPWIVLAVGAAIITMGGMLLGPSADHPPAVRSATSDWSAR
jgi:hypothetical protein